MNRKKFQKHCEELILYEQEILTRAKRLLEGKERLLDEHELKCAASLFWSNYAEPENITNERIPFNNCYMCSIYIAIYKKEDDFLNPDLEALSLIYPVTYIRKIFNFYKFYKLKTKNIEKLFNGLYEEVLLNGYEETLSKYQKLNKIK